MKTFKDLKPGDIVYHLKMENYSIVKPNNLDTHRSIIIKTIKPLTNTKYFDEINASEESQNQEYIYWLQYLYNYLSIDLRNREWAQEMIVLLDEEQFLSENKYLSHFFYRDFYMSAEPTCIRQSKNDTSINNEIYEEASYELRTSINNSNLNMMRALGGSIGPNALTDDTNEIYKIHNK